MIRIPDDAPCIVPGCDEPPCYSLGIRLRRRDTSAVWAPELRAYVCNKHGAYGADIDILYTPRTDREITSVVRGKAPGRASAIRTSKVN